MSHRLHLPSLMTFIVWWCWMNCMVKPISGWSITQSERKDIKLYTEPLATMTIHWGRREATLAVMSSLLSVVAIPTLPCSATDNDLQDFAQVSPSGDVRQLFNEARALESQGNMAAAQRIYAKVTRISPKFIYGWSNLGNTQVAFGDLSAAEDSYSTAINLCNENLRTTDDGFGIKRCSDLYVLLLNRGSVRLNHGMPKEALQDLQQASTLRGRPDAVILQNLARAEEVNGLYSRADRDYDLAISMTGNEVAPFWLRSALMKFQLGNIQSGFDILKRVEKRFPEAPEVRAAYATFLAARGDQIAAQQKYLEIPDRPRSNYIDDKYLKEVIIWPPAMIEGMTKVTAAVKM